MIKFGHGNSVKTCKYNLMYPSAPSFSLNKPIERSTANIPTGCTVTAVVNSQVDKSTKDNIIRRLRQPYKMKFVQSGDPSTLLLIS